MKVEGEPLPVDVACEPIHFLLTEGLKRKVKACRHNPAIQCDVVYGFQYQLQGSLTCELSDVCFHVPSEKMYGGLLCTDYIIPMTSYPQQWKPGLRNALHLCFSFLYSSPLFLCRSPFHINVVYIQLTHKRQKWTSLNPMPQSINSRTSASFQLLLLLLHHNWSPHPQFYYKLTIIRRWQEKAPMNGFAGLGHGWKCFSSG